MANVEKQSSKNDEELLFKKGAYAKITAGRHKGLYCQVYCSKLFFALLNFIYVFQIEGFDDEAGRVVVKLALKGLTLSLNEFLLSLVSKQEYEKSSKVISMSSIEHKISLSYTNCLQIMQNTKNSLNLKPEAAEVEEEMSRIHWMLIDE